MAGYYILKYGDEILYQAGNDDRPLHSVRLSSKTNGVDQLTFVMPPSHPLRHSMKVRELEKSVIVDYWTEDESYQPEQQHLFCGFISRMVEQIDGQLAVTCVSDAQLLADVHVRPNDRLPPTQLFAAVIAMYNNAMAVMGYDGRNGNPDRTFVNLTFSITDDGEVGFPDETISPLNVLGTIGSSPTSVLDILVNGIVQPYGCLMRTWRERGKRYIGLETADYVDTVSDWHFGDSGQSVIFGENMTTYESDTSDEGLYTGCYPMGGTDREDDSENSLGNGKWLRVLDDAVVGSTALRVAPEDGQPTTMKQGDVVFASSVAYVIRYGVTIPAEGAHIPISPSAIVPAEANSRAWYGGSRLTYTDSTVTLDRIADGLYNTDFQVVGGMVYHKPMVERYGLRTFTFNDSEIKTTGALLDRAMHEIVSQYHLKRSISVDAVDMAFYRRGYKHLLIGQVVMVEPKGLGSPISMRVMEANIDLGNPSATRYTLGQMPDGMLDRIRAARSDTDALRDRFVKELDNYIPSSTIRGLG